MNEVANVNLFDAERGSVASSRNSSFSMIQGHHGSGQGESLKLKLSNVIVRGRDMELETLTRAYQRMATTGMAEVVMVYGESGTGKSRLVEALRSAVASSNPSTTDEGGGFFASGRYEPLNKYIVPYAGIAAAFSDLIDLMQHCSEEERARLQSALRNNLGDELTVLNRLLSNLPYLTGVYDSATLVDPTKSRHGQAFTRFKTLCQIFLRTIATPQHPIVIVMDDLHVADEASLEVIKCFLKDKELKHCLIVCVYRNEGDKSFLHEDTSYFHLPHSEIRTSNLSDYNVNEIISSILNMDPERTQSLAGIVHAKTEGNPFHVLQFLEMLESESLLKWNKSKKTWEWDDDKVQSETNVSDNILNLLSARLQKLPQHVQEVLQVAACLGSIFQGQVLECVVAEKLRNVQTSGQSNTENDDISNDYSVKCQMVLNVAIREGLIERCSPHRGKMHFDLTNPSSSYYKFTHDQIQTTVYEMIPEGPLRDKVHLTIGRLLQRTFAEDCRHHSKMRFIVTDQLNRGVSYITNESERVALANLNLSAARMAIKKTSFGMAKNFLRSGISLLPCNAWKHYYKISLDLYAASAEVAHSTGNLAETKTFCDVVLTNGRNLRDKIGCYLLLIDDLGSAARLTEACAIGFDVLKKLGVSRFPRRPNKIHVVMELLRTNRALGKMEDDDLVDLPEMENENIMVAMKMLGILGRCAFFLQSGELLAMCTLRMTRLTLKYGISDHAPYGISGYGMLLSILRKHDKAFRYGRLAMKLLPSRHLSRGEAESQTLVIVYSMIHHFQRPLSEIYEPSVQAYERGHTSGDVGFACLAAFNAVSTLFVTGVPLNDIVDRLESYCQEMKSFKQESTLAITLPLLQAIQNHMGRSENPLVLTGDAMDQESFFRDAVGTGNDLGGNTIKYHRFQLCCYFEKWHDAFKILNEIFVDPNKTKGGVEVHFTYTSALFFYGLCYLNVYRLTAEKGVLQKADRVIAKISHVLEIGAVSYEPLLALLQAERLSLLQTSEICDSKNVFTAHSKRVVKAAYDKAIEVMKAHGFLHYQALANEKAGNVFKQRFQDFALADSYYLEAMDLFRQWGSSSKVKHLEQKHDTLAKPQIIDAMNNY